MQMKRLLCVHSSMELTTKRKEYKRYYSVSGVQHSTEKKINKFLFRKIFLFSLRFSFLDLLPTLKFVLEMVFIRLWLMKFYNEISCSFANHNCCCICICTDNLWHYTCIGYTQTAYTAHT